MIIIIEGPDGAGKSTMIEEIRQVHLEAGHSPESVQIWRRGPFPEGSNPWTEYVLPLTSLSPSKDWLVLIDRWHVGELVYGPLLRGVSRLSHEQRRWIDGYLKSLGALMIHLTASQEELIRRLAERGDDLIKAEHIPELLAGYADLLTENPRCLVMTRLYDTTGQKVRPTAKAIYTTSKLDAAIALVHQTHPSYSDQPYWEQHAWPS